MVWQVFGVSINNDINRHGISHAKTLINNQEGYTLICLNYVPLNFFFRQTCLPRDRGRTLVVVRKVRVLYYYSGKILPISNTMKM